ncbi:MAG: hypothetical protein KAU20_05665 [Nanoarchaeota archaeon]|nr:hypothetical protein [Nanoarchaeota archaeon]
MKSKKATISLNKVFVGDELFYMVKYWKNVKSIQHLPEDYISGNIYFYGYKRPNLKGEFRQYLHLHMGLLDFRITTGKLIPKEYWEDNISPALKQAAKRLQHINQRDSWSGEVTLEI